MTRAMYQVLVVEDEPGIRAVLRVLLESEQHRVVEADTAERAVIEARSHKPDLLLVDLGLPDGDGLELIRRVRKFAPVPIVVLSARTMEEQKIAALDAGADDYVTKPFSAPELLARVRAALRRIARQKDSLPRLGFGPLTVDLGRRVTTGPSGEVHLTPVEYRVLEALARDASALVTQRRLIREVWGPDRVDDSRNLRVVVRNLRQKLEPDPRRPQCIVTEAGVGYRLCAEVAAEN